MIVRHEDRGSQLGILQGLFCSLLHQNIHPSCFHVITTTRNLLDHNMSLFKAYQAGCPLQVQPRRSAVS